MKFQALLIVGLLGAIGSGCSNRLSLDNPGHPPVVPPVPAPPPLPTDHPTVSLVGAAVDATRLRIDWRRRAAIAEVPEVAVFVGTDSLTLYAGTPTLLDLAQSNKVINGLADTTVYFVGLAVRVQATDPWQPCGAVLRVRTGTPIYVDPNVLVSGDGTTPATATNDLVLAIFTAFVNGGGNVWVATGQIEPGTLPLFTGVHMYGGFDPEFRLGRRDTQLTPTTLVSSVNEIARIEVGSAGPAILDGLTLSGQVTVASAVDDPGLPLELRGLDIFGCQRGIKLRSTPVGTAIPVVLAGVSAHENALEGLSVDGAFAVVIEASSFDSNGNEGADFNHLVAPEGGTASLVARASTFSRNGTEGMDCHLGAPTGAGASGGQLTVHIEDCDFEANHLDGLRVDIDYELHPTWDADIVVRGTRARANGASGIHFDLDSRCTALAHRIESSANAQAGFLVTSESFRGQCSLSTSVLVGNFGPGVHASLGNYAVLAAHCVFSGNSGGGFVSDVVTSIAHSSVSYLQPDPWVGVVAHDCVLEPSDSPLPFLNAAVEFADITAIGAEDVTLAAVPTSGRGSIVEVQGDGVARTAVTLMGTSLVLDPAPVNQPVPARAAFFAAGSGVDEDWRLAASALAVGAGMAPPGARGIDAGVFGAPLAGSPGREDGVPHTLFFAGVTNPAWGGGVASNSSLEISFVNGAPEASSVPNSVFVRDLAGHSVPVAVWVRAGVLRVDPPIGGWLPGDVLELHASLTSTSALPLSVPLAIPLRP